MNQDLAALRWLLTSPPLLSGAAAARFASTAHIAQFSAPELVQINTWIDALEVCTQPLSQWLAAARATVRGHQPGVLRLGRMAERLLEFYLCHGPLHRLVAANLPLRHDLLQRRSTDHTTRGEIDFLLRDAHGVPLHWELAVKYFLCHATGAAAGAEDFVGPDGAETLDSKLAKLFTRQLAHAAPPPHHNVQWQAQAFTRGWMFYRYGQPIPHCNLLNPQHCKGWWLPIAELDALPDAPYVLLDRQHWMPRAQLDAACVRASRKLVREQLAHVWAQARGPYISALLIAQLNDQGGEVARYFVRPAPG